MTMSIEVHKVVPVENITHWDWKEMGGLAEETILQLAYIKSESENMQIIHNLHI